MAAPEVVRIEAAIANRSARELERALWYCEMRAGHPTTLAAHVRFWRELGERVKAAMAGPAEEKKWPAKKKRAGRGIGLGENS